MSTPDFQVRGSGQPVEPGGPTIPVGYLASWGRSESQRRVFTGADGVGEVVEEALAQTGDLYALMVHLTRCVEHDAAGVERLSLLAGHPYRAALLHRPAGTVTEFCGVQRAVPPLAFSIYADVDGAFGHLHPAMTRLTPGMARTVAVQWLATGTRPDTVGWLRLR